MSAVAAPAPSSPLATTVSSEAVVDPASSTVAAGVDVVVTLVPEAWRTAHLVRALGRRRDLLAGSVLVGWCGARELRLVHGPDSRRLTPVVDLLARALRPDDGAAGCPPLTLVDLPDGARLFDELVTGRRVLVAECVASGHEALQRWIRTLAATAARTPEGRTPGAAAASGALGEVDRDPR